VLVTIVQATTAYEQQHGTDTNFHQGSSIGEEELKPWVEKVEEVKNQTKVLRAYFNNHYGGAAVINALQFKEMLGNKLSENERSMIEHAQEYLSKRQSTLPV
jgi:uncharacterized protein YecE (DUF72 family)